MTTEDITLYPHEWIITHIDFVMQVIVSIMIMIGWVIIMYLFYTRWVLA